MSFPFPAVAHARPPAISDRELDRLSQLAHDARDGLCSPAEAEWVLSVAGPLLDELRQRRIAMARAGLQVDTQNVVVALRQGCGL